jgi:2-amino-4-hydroxy-6-hydroxymethyldihydropteridine diphosphokinase
MNGRAASERTFAFVALGCNLGDCPRTLADAAVAIDALPCTSVTAASSVYVTAPVGVDEPQPDYYNAVVRVSTALEPRMLLDALQRIETAAGRNRDDDVRNAPRTLDLDLVVYGDRVVDEPGLTVPHPRMAARAFVLAPFAEIAPDTIVPGHGQVRELLSKVSGQRISRLAVRLPTRAARR